MAHTISTMEFAEKIMTLDGKPWKFNDRPYIYPILQENPEKMLLMTGRQSEKSTTVSCRQIAYSCLHPNQSTLFVSPTMTQTSVYSKKKIDAVFEHSPLLKKLYHPGPKGFSVGEKILKNGHTLYLRSAYRDADTIRGISSDGTNLDEIQDIPYDAIAIIEECSGHKPHATFMYTGTPKSMSNTIQSLWEKSTQSEWTVKCMHCGCWNILSVKNIQINNPGIWCEKCGRDIQTRNGTWINHASGFIKGYRFPQIILPAEYISWPRLFNKIQTYSTPQLMNEVFGHSYDSGTKPITQAEIYRNCSLDRKCVEVHENAGRGFNFFAGIDWAAGTGNCYSVLVIGYHDHSRDKIVITYAKRYMGDEANPSYMIPHMRKMITLNDAKVIGADYGFGFGLNSQLRETLGKNFGYAQMFHTAAKHYVGYNTKSQFYTLGRTEVLTDVIQQIKTGFFEFFDWEEFKTFAQDILNEDIEYNERTNLMKYDHLPSRPDDFLHALLFLYIGFQLRLQRRKAVNYNPDVDPIDTMGF